MSSFDLTRRAIAYGSPDPVTGWLAKSYTNYTVQGSIQPRGGGIMGLLIGSAALYPQTLFTSDVARVGDQYIDAQTQHYLCKVADQWWRGNQFSHYTCNLQKIDPHYDRPTTSGTWHVDSEADKTDPRNRIKVLLDGFMAAVYKDNGTSAASVHFCFDHPDHPFKAFFDAGYNAVGAISCAPSTPRYAYTHEPYGFDEHVTIYVYAMNQTGITASNLLEQIEQAIRHTITAYGISSATIRSITNTKPATVDLEGMILYGIEINLLYARANEDYLHYASVVPSVTWGASATPSGTYFFPNTTYISTPITVNNTRLMPPGRMGSILQKMGMPDFLITTRHDLDIEPSDITWKRPQLTDDKTDILKYQVFYDIAFNGQYAATQTYQTLDLGWGGTLKVTLEEVTPILDAEGNTLELTWAVYSASSGSAYKTWFGISP